MQPALALAPVPAPAPQHVFDPSLVSPGPNSSPPQPNSSFHSIPAPSFPYGFHPNHHNMLPPSFGVSSISLTNATDEDLIMARNRAYMKLKTQYETLETCYSQLLKAIPSTSNPAPLQPSASANTSPPPAPKETDCACNFWTQAKFMSAYNAKTAISTAYLEDEQGQPISKVDRSLIYNAAYAFWNELAETRGIEPPVWTKTSMTVRQNFYTYMESNFPKLALCAGHYKCKQVWLDNFNTWRRSYRKSHQQEEHSDPDSEDDTEEDDSGNEDDGKSNSEKENDGGHQGRGIKGKGKEKVDEKVGDDDEDENEQIPRKRKSKEPINPHHKRIKKTSPTSVPMFTPSNPLNNSGTTTNDTAEDFIRLVNGSSNSTNESLTHGDNANASASTSVPASTSSPPPTHGSPTSSPEHPSLNKPSSSQTITSTTTTQDNAVSAATVPPQTQDLSNALPTSQVNTTSKSGSSPKAASTGGDVFIPSDKITGMGIFERQWKEANPNGTKAEFAEAWKALTAADKKQLNSRAKQMKKEAAMTSTST
ncbi:hypothetical protein VNI00_016620 [Paramarasmius palmivorus]|uniref:Uncharacterized protein n=1 Tax=Paramarasmius palmivorus TaxID=297713 RepID=A0AAW0BE37_9AGAR